MLENTEWIITNGQPRDKSNIGQETQNKDKQHLERKKNTHTTQNIIKMSNTDHHQNKTVFNEYFSIGLI